MSLHCVPVPAPGFEKNPGIMPDRAHWDARVQVQWACGWIDPHPYLVRQLRWTLTGFRFDVGAVRAA